MFYAEMPKLAGWPSAVHAAGPQTSPSIRWGIALQVAGNGRLRSRGNGRLNRAYRHKWTADICTDVL